jgi:hypothetical protein
MGMKYFAGLINGVNLCGKMRKSLGSKRNVMDEADIATITRSFGGFEVVTRELDKPAEQKSNRGRQSANPKTAAPKTFSSKIFHTNKSLICFSFNSLKWLFMCLRMGSSCSVSTP